MTVNREGCRKGGLIGGHRRAEVLSAERRREIAAMGGRASWSTTRKVRSSTEEISDLSREIVMMEDAIIQKKKRLKALMNKLNWIKVED